MRWFNRRRGQRHDELISAHEIACFAYCPAQWRLQDGLALEAQNQAELKAGTRHHAGKAAAERVAGWSIRLGQAILLAALLLLALWLLLR